MVNKIEQDIQREIIKYFKDLGWPVMKHHNERRRVGGGRGGHAKSLTPGISDLQVTIPPEGLCLWIEVKTPKGVVSESQKRFMSTQEKAGAYTLVARSLEDVTTYLQFHHLLSSYL